MVIVDRKLRKPSAGEYAGSFLITSENQKILRALVYPILPIHPAYNPEIRVVLDLRGGVCKALYDPNRRELLIYETSPNWAQAIKSLDFKEIERRIFVFLIRFFNQLAR